MRESEERFRNMADTAPVMIWVSDENQQITFFNKTWLEFTGRTMEQELRDGWASGVHPDDLERCVRMLRLGIRCTPELPIGVPVAQGGRRVPDNSVQRSPTLLDRRRFRGVHRFRYRYHRSAERRTVPATGGKYRSGFLDARPEHRQGLVCQPRVRESMGLQFCFALSKPRVASARRCTRKIETGSLRFSKR